MGALVWVVKNYLDACRSQGRDRRGKQETTVVKCDRRIDSSASDIGTWFFCLLGTLHT